jgi:hypothetical protein
MDPSRDHPLFRFKAFWWGLGLFLLFTVALVIVGLANRKPAATLEDAAAVARLQKRATADAAQAGKLKVPPSSKFAETGRRLLGQKPLAVEKPEQVVPGSPTQLKLAPPPAPPAAPPAGSAPPAAAPAPATPTPEQAPAAPTAPAPTPAPATVTPPASAPAPAAPPAPTPDAAP